MVGFSSRRALAAVGVALVVSNASLPAAAPQGDGAQAAPAGGETTGVIRGDVVVDVDADGAITGADRRLAGVVVEVSGVGDDGSDVEVTVETDEVGRFEVNDLPPGTYTVREHQPAGWLDGEAVAGTSGVPETHDAIAEVRVDAGAATTGLVFLEGAASLSGAVVSHVGGNTWVVPDATVHVEPARSGSTAVVGESVTSPAETSGVAVTGDDGSFTVRGLAVGAYEVVVEGARLGSASGAVVGVVEVDASGDVTGEVELSVELTSIALPVAADEAGRIEVLDPLGRIVATVDYDAETESLTVPTGGWTLRVLAESTSAASGTAEDGAAVVREIDVLAAEWRDTQPVVVLDGSDPAAVAAKDDSAPAPSGGPGALAVVGTGLLTAMVVAGIAALSPHAFDGATSESEDDLAVAGLSEGACSQWIMIVMITPVSSDAEHTNHERLMDAAVEVVAERGYDGAGVAEIARRAGLTTGAIYSRFTGKADLLAEAVDARVPEALRDVLAGAGDEPAANLLARLGDRLVSVQDTPGDALLIEAIVASRRDDVLADRLRARFEEQRSGVAKLVEEGKADGTIDSALDTDAVVKFAHALGLGFLLHRILDTPLPEQRHWQAVIERLLVAASPTPSSEDRP